MGCQTLEEDRLPESSRSRLKKLTVCSYTLERLPAGLRALLQLELQDCYVLGDGWLHLSSTGQVQKLTRLSTVLCVPSDMPMLKHLCASEDPEDK